jgi:hypothetical protein
VAPVFRVAERDDHISIAQFDTEGHLLDVVVLDYDAAGWYRQEMADIERIEWNLKPEAAARFKRRLAVAALSRMGIEV